MKIIFEYEDGSADEVELNPNSKESNGKFCRLMSSQYKNRYIISNNSVLGNFKKTEDIEKELRKELNELKEKIPKYLKYEFHWKFKDVSNKLHQEYFDMSGFIKRDEEVKEELLKEVM